MTIQRSRFALALVVAGLVALPGCGDEAKDVQNDIDRGAGTVDERAKDAANDAKDATEDAAGDAGDKIEEGDDDDDGE